MNLVLMDVYHCIQVFQDYVTKIDNITISEDLTVEELQFMLHAVEANTEMKKIQDDARLSGVGDGGRHSEDNKFKSLRDALGETDKIRIYTRMQESLQAMATLISDGDVEHIKTYLYERRSYEMSTIINTLMHDAASNIVRLSSRFGPLQAPKDPKASMHTLLLRLHSISI